MMPREMLRAVNWWSWQEPVKREDVAFNYSGRAAPSRRRLQVGSVWNKITEVN